MRTDAAVGAWAQALFVLSQADDAVEQVDADLTTAAETIAGHRKLKDTLDDEGVPAARKATLVAEVFGEGLSPVVVGALVSLTLSGRLDLLPGIHEAYEAASEEARNVAIADVTTATPLDKALRVKLAKKLESIAGKRVILREHVDPAVLGGAVVRMGGKIMDGSVRAQLAKMRQEMTGVRSEA